MKLGLYHKKRDFKKTPEPKGKVSHQYKNLFIIQKHAASHLHYDFRLELGGILLSWAVPKGPSLDPSIKRLAMHVEDHPVEYGHFEGIIPQGQYGGGTVMLWDQGIWIPEDEDPLAAYQKGHLRFRLEAEKLNGRFSLIRFKKADDKAWFLIKGKDEYAKPQNKYDITVKEPNSVLTGYSIDEIAENYKNVWGKKGLVKAPKKKPRKATKASPVKIALKKSTFPTHIKPELATLVDKPPEGSEWLHEIKWDGYRILAYKEGKEVWLVSRNNKDWTRYFKAIAKTIQAYFPKDVILDGEIVLLDSNQRSSFQLLQNAISGEEESPFIYYIFDVLYYDQYNLMPLPLVERKNILQQLLSNAKDLNIRYSDHIIGQGAELFKNACDMTLEGIVSKNGDSPYEQKRTKSWLKIKCGQRQEFVIGGFTPPQGSRQHFGSLYLGYYDDKGKLQYCGNVGTGFNQASLKTIYDALRKNICAKNPFSRKPPGSTTAIWVNPVLVAEVAFSEWTNEGSLRHPSFQGLRLDKSAKVITREKSVEAKTMTPSSFKLTHPNKVLYPEDNITKQDLADYYQQIQEWILPYIINRPLTVVRCPENYQSCFYQKHINNTTPVELHGLPLKEKEKTSKMIYINDHEGLMALVQMGSLELHPWGSRIEKVEYPDMITFDLDPAPGVAWKKVVEAAKRLRKHLKAYGLESFVKTTGGKGLHVVVPILPEYDWNTVKQFSHLFVQHVVSKYPDEYVSEMSKAKRTGKIFMDYLRNQRGATAVSAYSTRARLGAPVAVPLSWNELTHKREDTAFTIKTLPKRLAKLKSDPWKDFFKIKQSLNLPLSSF